MVFALSFWTDQPEISPVKFVLNQAFLQDMKAEPEQM